MEEKGRGRKEGRRTQLRGYAWLSFVEPAKRERYDHVLPLSAKRVKTRSGKVKVTSQLASLFQEAKRKRRKEMVWDIFGGTWIFSE